jgi:PAS domain S-box-containing protein
MTGHTNLIQLEPGTTGFYRMIADYTVDWEEWLAPTGCYLYVSPSSQQITGFPPAAFIDSPLLMQEIVHPDDRQQFCEHHQKVLNGQEGACELEFRILHQDGSTRWISHFCQPIFSPDGAWLGQRGSNRDITSRKYAEEQLRESLQTIMALLNAPIDIACLVDTEGRILLANRPMAETFGHTPETIKGQLLWDFFTSVQQEVRRKLLAQVIESRQMVRIVDSTGERQYDSTLCPIFGPDHQVSRIAILSRDISERIKTEAELEQHVTERTTELEQANLELKSEITMRKQAEAVLLQQNEYIKSIVNTAQVIMVILAPNGQIVQINPYMEKLSGYSNAEMLGKDWHDTFIPQGDREALRKLLKETMNGRRVSGKINTIIAKDGRERQIEWENAILQDDSQQIVGLLSTGQDVTDRLAAEINIRQHAARAEALARVAAGINTRLDLKGVLQNIVDEIISVASYPVCIVMLYEEASDRLYTAAAAYRSGIIPQPVNEISRTSFEALVQQKSFLIIPDAQAVDMPAHQNTIQDLSIRSVVVMPMYEADALLGCLLVSTRGDTQPPEDNEIMLLRALADQAATAIANARLFEQVLEARQRLAVLSQRLVDVQESERRDLARELHDEIGQMLTSLNLNLDIISRILQRPDATRQAIEAEIEQARHQAQDLLARVRELSLDLRPALLDDMGLLPALLALFERFTAQTDIRVSFKHSNLIRRYPAKVETAAFRIIQEALTNIARHTGEKQASVRLWANASCLKLQIEDKGAGFNVQQVLAGAKTSGLSGMYERAASCDGWLEIESEPGMGVCLSAEFPIQTIGTE